MAWTTPKTNWATGELVTAEDMNAVGENLAALKNPSTAVGTTTAEVNSPGSFSDIDSDNLNLTISTTGGDVLAHFEGKMKANHSTLTACVYLDIEVDGQRLAQDNNGITEYLPSPHFTAVSTTRLIRNLSAGIHTFKLQWRSAQHRTRTSGRLDDGAQFWVREV